MESSLILVRALVIAPASPIAPFASSQIIRALIAGDFVFGDPPDLWMLFGFTVISRQRSVRLPRGGPAEAVSHVEAAINAISPGVHPDIVTCMRRARVNN